VLCGNSNRRLEYIFAYTDFYRKMT
jgi:hypothetical protein